MKLTNHLVFYALLLTSVFFSSISNAALFGRDLDGNLTTSEAYYDNESNLTWLASTVGPGHVVNYNAADSWVTGLNLGGITDWRLPTTLQPDPSCDTQNFGLSYGYNCTGSELGNMFYNVLGGQAGSSITTIHNINYDLFSPIEGSIYYWTSTTDPTLGGKWVFRFGDGNQGAFGTGSSFLAWAVHDGDVGATVVPVPISIWLFSSGLLGLAGVARRKKT